MLDTILTTLRLFVGSCMIWATIVLISAPADSDPAHSHWLAVALGGLGTTIVIMQSTYVIACWMRGQVK